MKGAGAAAPLMHTPTSLAILILVFPREEGAQPAHGGRGKVNRVTSPYPRKRQRVSTLCLPVMRLALSLLLSLGTR